MDNTYPERLAKVCAEEGRNEFLFTATPLRLLGAPARPRIPSPSSDHSNDGRSTDRGDRALDRSKSVVTPERFKSGRTFEQYLAYIGTPENLARGHGRRDPPRPLAG